MTQTPQAERTDTAITVRVVADVPAAALWEVLADPRRHPELDGSGMVRAAAGTTPITAVGDVFTTAMHHDAAPPA